MRDLEPQLQDHSNLFGKHLSLGGESIVDSSRQQTHLAVTMAYDVEEG